MRVRAVIVLLASCWTNPPIAPPPPPADVRAVAEAASYQVDALEAEWTCRCAAGHSGLALCEQSANFYIHDDHTLALKPRPLMFRGDRSPASTTPKTCWGRLDIWTATRKGTCTGDASDPPDGPAPYCGTPPTYAFATIAPWWTKARPCPPNETLVTAENPLKPGKLLAAWCTSGASAAGASHVTKWYLTGSLESDRTRDRRDDYWPHGTRVAHATVIGTNDHGGPIARWTYYFPNGAVSDRGERSDGVEIGNWQGFRDDGSLEYRARFEPGAEPKITWLGRDGTVIAEPKPH